MKLPAQWKLTALVIGFALLLVFIQWVLIFPFQTSLPLATLISFVCVSIAASLLLKPLVRQIQNQPVKPPEKTTLQTNPVIKEIPKEKDYLLTVLKGMTEGVLVVDERGRIQMVNEALRKLFPLPESVLNRTLLELIRNAELEEAIRMAISHGRSSTFEITLPSSPGRNFEVHVDGIPLLAEKGSQTGQEWGGAIAVFHDITRLKELERVRQDFVANVSHELRTPLTTILGYAETLLDGALKEEVAIPFLKVIQKQTGRLTKIVENLLTLSKIETKEFQPKLEKISFSELLEDIFDLFKEVAEKKNISISTGHLPSSLIVEADRNGLEQILMNLIDNGIKYGRQGGEIVVSAIQNDRKEIEVSIKDNGMGIPREDLSRIFERFYRVDKGRSQDLGGTGLGLSIVKHLVQAHEGRVWAESQPGEGSTFYFTLSTYPSPHPSPPRG